MNHSMIRLLLINHFFPHISMLSIIGYDLNLSYYLRFHTSIFLMITLFPLVYKKFFPFGSPPSTIGCPL